MAWFPNAVRKPLPRGFGTRMARYDLYVVHTMVGSLAGTDGYFRGLTNGVNSHFGIGGFGENWQWGDTAFRSGANGGGNHRAITAENADMGPGFAPWDTRNGAAVPALTPQQIETNAQNLALAHQIHGVPLQMAPNSLPGSRGLAYHRQGIDPWRVPGGEVWSSSRGKVCPADRRVAQLPLILNRAIEIVNGDDMNAAQEAKLNRLMDINERLLVELMGDYGPNGRSLENGHEVVNAEGAEPVRVTLRQAVLASFRETTWRGLSGVPGSTFMGTTFDYSRNADAYSYAAIRELAGLRSVLDGLVEKLSDGGQVDVEAFRTMLREELPKLEVVTRVDRSDEDAPTP